MEASCFLLHYSNSCKIGLMRLAMGFAVTSTCTMQVRRTSEFEGEREGGEDSREEGQVEAAAVNAAAEWTTDGQELLVQMQGGCWGGMWVG